MLILTNPGTADLIDLVTGAAVNIDVHATFIDCTSTPSPPVVDAPSRTNTGISTATTTTIVAGPASGKVRNVKTLHIRNRGSASCDVTVRHNISGGTTAELHKATLQPGDMLEYVEGVGFFQVASATKLDAKLRVAADVTNNTTSAADITGLTQAIKSGKHYNFEAGLFVLSAATTTGVQLQVNGPAMTGMRVTANQTVTGSATAATMSVPVADIAALNTTIIVQTTGPANVVYAHVFGWLNPSADGTFALRLLSEVATSTVTVKQGSWCRIWEADN